MTNLVNILKYCPEGTKLYSPIFGEVTFKKISSSNDIFCRVTKDNGKAGMAAMFMYAKDAQAVIDNPNFRDILDTLCK